jgi:hypothetical protein
VATLLFYERPVPLSADAHRNTRLGRLDNDFRFCRTTNSIPLAAVEFFDAARELPIAFTGQEGGAQFPIAIVGVRQNENLLVEADGRWGGRYVPAFVRRYPFVLAEKENAEDFNVYIDEGYPGYDAQDGERLFTDDGERTPLLKQALDFLSVYQGEIRRTRLFVEKLQALDLLVPRVLQVARPGEAPMVLQGFSVVDEQKLQALDDGKLLDLARSGLLAWIHAHLMSLGNVGALADRVAPASGKPEPAAAATEGGAGETSSPDEVARPRTRAKTR